MNKTSFLFIVIASLFLFVGIESNGPMGSSSQWQGIDWGRITLEENPFPKDFIGKKEFAPNPRDKSKSPRSGIAGGHEFSPPTLLDTIFVELHPGECFTDTFVCSVPDFPPVADILIDFDLTGSMGAELDSLKVNSIGIMNAIRAEIPNSFFGLISAEDYNNRYEDIPPGANCGYGGIYGEITDSPYRLDIPLTSGIIDVSDAINAMALGSGFDNPEDYARQFYESIAELIGDTNLTFGPIGWRTEAKKIVLAFNDATPHTCNWLECVGLTCGVPIQCTGKDPGRDEILNTGDDLEIMDVLNQMASYNVSLVDVYSGSPFLEMFWDCWTGITPGGGAFVINSDGSIPDGVAIDSFIVNLIESTFDTLEEVSLRVCGGDPSFLHSVTPPSYFDVPTPSELFFELEFCVPLGTNPGTYCIDVCTYTDDNLLLCTYTICIEVTSGVGAEEEKRPEGNLSNRFELFENSPNPFHSTTLIRYQIPEGVGARRAVPVRLEIFDITGRLVETLVNESSALGGSGVYRVIWDGRGHTSGVYFYRLTAQGLDGSRPFTASKRLVLLR